MKLRELERMRNMSNTAIKTQNQSSWRTKATYEKVNADINNEWPKWKKEAYNEMFAVSAHAKKVVISK